MNPGAMNMAQMARALNNVRTYPAVRTFTPRNTGAGFEANPTTYYPQPVMLFPYGNYMYVQPFIYQPLPPTRQYSNFSRNKNFTAGRNTKITDNVPVNVFSKGFSTEAEEDTFKNIDDLSVFELHRLMYLHLQKYPRAKLSWLNKLFIKVTNPAELNKSLEIFDIYHQRVMDISPETGTLLIKAACRAGEPEKALALLKAIERVRIWPTLGGIHYLMINFSLKKDTNAVKETFEAAKLRNLKPSMRSYQILIRECVDHGLMDDAMKYIAEAEKEGVEPNRVTYNIVMNGLRRAGKADDILKLRQKMNELKLEMNDTTIKFTALAYMMLQDVDNAVREFMSFSAVSEKLDEFCNKFFEVIEDNDETQKGHVIALFSAVSAKGVSLPTSVVERMNTLKPN